MRMMSSCYLRLLRSEVPRKGSMSPVRCEASRSLTLSCYIRVLFDILFFSPSCCLFWHESDIHKRRICISNAGPLDLLRVE
jgi:hypothetical protein